ncbi:MAG: single-stranded-DNA-specific exonuclease RecJ [Alphaproteobacteria bacterium]|nr:single-stranded-DNA-specific exonuclease RecJ [Alphaproteobacteria bacterium]
MQNGALSILGQKWLYQAADEKEIEFLKQQLGLPYALCRILVARGVSAENAENFLNPKIQKLMPDPSCLKDMDKTASFLADVVQNKEKTGIIGDYDVDGATSSALLKKYLAFFGIDVVVHIPERDEGYGPNKAAFDEFEASGIRAVVTADCGTTAFDALEEAANRGFKIAVIDHHEAETRLPKVLAVVNPKRLDEKNDYPYLRFLAAVGVVFLVLAATNRELARRGFFENHEKPDLMSMLDLVALGTVCDVVPLLGLNRAYVTQGLKIIAQRTNLGLTTLIDNAGVHERPTTYHLGYVLGPRINAGGRVGVASIGHKLLCADSPQEALELAKQLNEFNVMRKDIEAHVLTEAIEQIEKAPSKYPIAFAFNRGWHQGVVGIVAGKLKERYHVPSFVMSVEEDEVKGSARSVAGVDLGALIMCAKEKGVIKNGGGHMMAAGFSLDESKIEDFRTFVGEYIKAKLPDEELVPTVFFDAVLSFEGATLDLAEKFNMLAPFGADNPEPKVVLENIKIIKPMEVGDGHVRCAIKADCVSGSLKAICFKCVDNALGSALLNAEDKHFNALGTLRVDEWMNNKTIQFTIEDLMER